MLDLRVFSSNIYNGLYNNHTYCTNGGIEETGTLSGIAKKHIREGKRQNKRAIENRLQESVQTITLYIYIC